MKENSQKNKFILWLNGNCQISLTRKNYKKIIMTQAVYNGIAELLMTLDSMESCNGIATSINGYNIQIDFTE